MRLEGRSVASSWSAAAPPEEGLMGQAQAIEEREMKWIEHNNF